MRAKVALLTKRNQLSRQAASADHGMIHFTANWTKFRVPAFMRKDLHSMKDIFLFCEAD